MHGLPPEITTAQPFERGKRVPVDEVVNVRQRRHHSGGHRCVAGLPAVRVDPDHAVRQPVQPLHLATEQVGVAPLPAVRRDDDDGTAGDAALAPPVEEGLEQLAEPGAAAPVGHRCRRPPAAPPSGSRSLHLAGDAGQPGADREDLGPGSPPRRGVREPQVGVGVGLHRPADVDDQHEPARPHAALPVLEPHRFAAATQHRAHGPPRVERAAARPLRAVGSAAARPPGRSARSAGVRRRARSR